MRDRTRLVVAVALAALLLVVAGPGAAPAQTKPVVWNLPHVATPTYYITTNLNAFAAKVKEKSQGRMEIRVHPASSLYPGPEILPALRDGRADIGMVLSVYTTDVLLEVSVLELPFMTSNLAEHRRAGEQLKPFYTEMLAKRGLRPLAMYPWPSQQLFSARPVRTVQDWKGLKVRVYGAESSDLARSIGAAPASIPSGEMYIALQRGVVDAALTSATNAEPLKLHEVSKYLNYWYFAGAALEWLCVNEKSWEALPKDLQQVVLDALKDVRFEDKVWEDAHAWEERARKRAQDLGITVVDVPAEEIDKARKLSRSAWDVWLKRTGANGKRALELALKALGRTQ